MSHFMARHRPVPFVLDKPRACVMVKKEGKRLVVIPDSVNILKAETQLFWLDEMYEVVSEDGQPVKATGKFAVSAQTIDPYYALTDIF